jgi:glycosyltransferase involved in cell wall biosynthesis
MKNSSVIISYRETSPDRRKNIDLVLEHLRYIDELREIIIVEQDDHPLLPETDFYKHIFLHNEGYFNKSWAYNVGASAATGTKLIFHDCDILLKTRDLVNAVGQLDNYEAIKPSEVVYDVQKNAPDPFECKEIQRMGSTFAGGVVLLRKEAFFRIYGWDEEFSGWGKEDNAMSAKIFVLLSHTTLKSEMFHLYHQDSIGAVHKDDPQMWKTPTNLLKFRTYVKENQERYLRNGILLEMVQEIALQGKEKLLDYYKSKPPIGNRKQCPLEYYKKGIPEYAAPPEKNK